MKAGDHQDAVGFRLIKEAVRKASHSRPPSLPKDNREPQWRFFDELNGLFDGLNESL